jgi:hypothetical protein
MPLKTCDFKNALREQCPMLVVLMLARHIV